MILKLNNYAAPALLRARWFDGTSSRARAALVSLHSSPRGPSLRLHPLAPDDAAPAPAPRDFSHAQVGWPERWSAQRLPPRVVIDLREAGSLELDDAAAWHAALQAAGEIAPLAQRMQTHWPVLLGVLAVAAIALAAFYRWGTPWAATQLARYVPLPWETALSERALAELDARQLKPSQLPPERQAALRQRFAALLALLPSSAERGPLQPYPGYAPAYALQFRSGMPANAFALPGGSIVMTDRLVALAASKGLSDDALVGVLAHELGHVAQRHTTRMVVEQGVLNAGLGLALGDVSSALSLGSALLTGLVYRRNHETEADCFGLALMQRAALPTEPLADLLLALGEPEGKGKPASEASGIAELLSSHPDTQERARRLKSGARTQCP